MADPDQQDIESMANDNNLYVYFSRIFKQEQQKNKICTESNTHPVTGSNVHLCIFDKFHEGNMTSKIEALRHVGNVPDLSGKFKFRKLTSNFI